MSPAVDHPGAPDHRVQNPAPIHTRLVRNAPRAGHHSLDDPIRIVRRVRLVALPENSAVQIGDGHADPAPPHVDPERVRARTTAGRDSAQGAVPTSGLCGKSPTPG